MLGAEQSIQLSNLNIVSPDSVSYVFDHRANGFSRGEGVVALVLKPVADAVRDGDAIRAVIRATGTNQNGKSNHIAHPSAELQEALIRHVYRKAELPLNETCYVEAHGV
jgi:acyl transferase domain-containing protein